MGNGLGNAIVLAETLEVEETTWQTVREWRAALGSFGALAVALYVGVGPTPARAHG